MFGDFLVYLLIALLFCFLLNKRNHFGVVLCFLVGQFCGLLEILGIFLMIDFREYSILFISLIIKLILKMEIFSYGIQFMPILKSSIPINLTILNATA